MIPHVDPRDWAGHELRKMPIHEAAGHLGLSHRGRRYPCLLCGTEILRSEHRGPVGVFANGLRWKCNACQGGGDAINLICAARYGKLQPQSAEEWKEILRTVNADESTGPRSGHLHVRPVPVPAPPAPSYPGQVAAGVFGQLRPLNREGRVEEWLDSRRISPVLCAELDLVRSRFSCAGLPADQPGDEPDLLRWLPVRYAAVLATRDCDGQIQSLRYRAIEGEQPKSRAPGGYAAQGLLLADPFAVALLRGQAPGEAEIWSSTTWDGDLVIVEGEMDFLTWATHPNRIEPVTAGRSRSYAVVGLTGATMMPQGLPPLVAQVLRRGRRAALRQHADKAGEKLLQSLLASLPEDVRGWLLCLPDPGEGQGDGCKDDNDRLMADVLPASPWIGCEEAAGRLSAGVPEPVIGDGPPEGPQEGPPAPASALQSVKRVGLRPMPASWLESPPAARQWLLEEERPLGPTGWLPRGEVGLLAAPGGTGKSWLLCSLALAVATGAPMVPGGCRIQPVGRGRVAVILGEEPATELHRRVWAQRSRMTPDQQQTLQPDRLLILTRDDQPEPLIRGAREQHPCSRTEYAIALEAELQRYAEEDPDGLALVILDPLSAFGGPDAEVDNHAATRVMQEIERFTRLPGNPTVLIAHHTRKGASSADSPDVDNIRGAGGLVARARWAAMLRREGEVNGCKLLSLDIVKSNYTGEGRSLWLAQPVGWGGAMRSATADEVTAWEAERQDNRKRKPERQEPDQEGKIDKFKGKRNELA